jgi:integrase
VKRGEDPSADRRSTNQAPTIADLADRHIEEHAKIKNKARSAKRARQLWDRCILPKLGKRKVADIGRADIAKLITDMANTKGVANKVITLLSVSFNLAEVWGWRTEGSNPCRHIQRFKEEGRERYLSELELKRLGEVLVRIEYERSAPPQAVVAIRLLIFTGCRSAEILQLRWEEVDFERQCLNLSDSKTGRRTVMLNTAALEILQGIDRVGGSPFVIPGRTPDRPLTSLQRLWNRVRVEADIADVRCHDIRHTYASFGINSGQNLSVIGKLLGHAKILTTQRYAHLADDPLRRANEQIGSTLAASLMGRPMPPTEGDSH